MKSTFKSEREVRKSKRAVKPGRRSLEGQDDREFGFSSPPRVACVLLKKSYEKQKIQALAESCFRFSPQIALRGEEAIFIEIGKSLHLFDEESISKRLHALARRFGVDVRVAVSDHVCSSLARSRWVTSEDRLLPLEALYDYISPFEPISQNLELFKQVQKMIETLNKLGVETLEEFQRLSSGELSSRFGREGFELGEIIREQFLRAWPQFRSEKKIMESLQVSDWMNVQTNQGCDQIEPLLFLAKSVIDRIIARLRGRGERASAMEFTFKMEKYSTVQKPIRKWVIQFPTPQGSHAGILTVLRERWMMDLQREPIESPVQFLQIQVLQTAPGYGAQKNFFHQREEQREAWDELIAALCGRLGGRGAFQARLEERYLPEKSWSETLEENQMNQILEKKETEVLLDQEGLEEVAGGFCEDLSGFQMGLTRGLPLNNPTQDMLNGDPDQVPNDRPTRLLDQPIALKKDGAHLKMMMVDQRTFKEWKKWKALEWEGPERISGEWWDSPKELPRESEDSQEGFQRDYYKVITDTGEELWVFSVPHKDGVFLHGYFD